MMTDLAGAEVVGKDRRGIDRAIARGIDEAHRALEVAAD
jgi:hypothetical protein